MGKPMNVRTLASATVAGVAVGGALLLVRPPTAGAFALTGDSLGVFTRTVRVFDNFTDPEANANTQPDPAFPGFTGAELALWKAAIEWSSEPHGSGGGDPHQPYGLGSGGANFDFVWLGNATSVGSADDNTCSELAGSGGGVIAFCEAPSSDGWRIRFYGGELWWGDPNKIQIPLGKDLQGVATHELGHALGLNHSADSNATMYAVVTAGALHWRSLESDDAAGVQAIYGARSAAKPSIDTYDFPSPGVLRVRGSGFAAQQNELWFTPTTPGASAPVVVGGLASSAGGTELVANLPAGVGGGDVLVKLPGSAHDSLSAPCPFDLAGPPCEVPRMYGVAKLTSTGATADIGWTGEPSVQLANLELSLLGPPGGEQAVLFQGAAKRQTPFCGGELSIGGALKRVATTQLDFFGFVTVKVPAPAALVGTTRYFQWWYSDPADPFGCGTSNALEIFFCP
ncbi:MAG: matrixin family metalloprotease [Planctomycetes bacterium]|nr:matrixin family metalloprotease [Planctomycetota bacterium]